MLEKIEKIERDRIKKDLFWIYLEDGHKVCLYGDLVIKHGLNKGKEVSKGQLEEWQRENEALKCFDTALNYLSFRPRSRKEMEDYLSRKGFGIPSIELTLYKLENYGYIDDVGFANSWIKSRLSSKPMSKRLIARELYQKGIDKELIDGALEMVGEEEEEQAALTLAQKYLKRYERFEQKEKFYKISQALARRGFEWTLIQRVCRQLRIAEDKTEYDE